MLRNTQDIKPIQQVCTPNKQHIDKNIWFSHKGAELSYQSSVILATCPRVTIVDVISDEHCNRSTAISYRKIVQ